MALIKIGFTEKNESSIDFPFSPTKFKAGRKVVGPIYLAGFLSVDMLHDLSNKRLRKLRGLVKCADTNP